MNTTSRILATIAAINLLRAAATQLQAPEGFTSESDLSEFYLVHDASGQLVAVGYSEADLLANLQKLEQAEGLEHLRVQQLAGIEHLSKNFAYSVFAGKQGPLSGSGCRAQLEAEGVRQ